EIERMWARCPTANVAIATEGLLVVDVDAAASPWPGDPERMLDLAVAPLSLTPRGGSHRVFRQPPGKNWRCTVGRLAPHADPPARPAATAWGRRRWRAGRPTAGRRGRNSTSRPPACPGRRPGWSRSWTGWPTSRRRPWPALSVRTSSPRGTGTRRWPAWRG